MPRDGCRECLYRRIKCDKTDPSCQKCVKKGIECTGVGKFCFVSGVTRRRRKHNPPSSASPSSPGSASMITTPKSQVTQAHSHDEAEDGEDSLVYWPVANTEDQDPCQPDQPWQQLAVSANRHSLQTVSLHQSLQPLDLRADLALEGLKPGISNLLMTCKWSRRTRDISSMIRF